MRPATRSNVSHPHAGRTPTGRSVLQFSRADADRKVGATIQPDPRRPEGRRYNSAGPTPTGRSALQCGRTLADRKGGATPLPVRNLCPRAQSGSDRILMRVLDVITPLFLTSDHVVVILALPELTVNSQQLIRLLSG